MINKTHSNYKKEELKMTVVSHAEGSNRKARRERIEAKKRYTKDHKNNHQFVNQMFYTLSRNRFS